MKIGVLTFHRSFNYGAFAQCYSLITKLKEDFPNHEIEVIDYSSKKAIDSYSVDIEKQKNKKTKQQLIERNKSFYKCQESLPLSKYHAVSDDYKETVEYLNENYDVIIVGSDAVWNWNTRGFPNLYFLKDFKGIKFSYAASAHGLTYQNMSGEQKDYLNNAFSEFDYIGVRDETTSNMVHFVNDTIKTNFNCDPTMLLDVQKVPCDEQKLKEKLISKGVDFSKPLIGIMAGNSIGYEIKKRFGKKVQLIGVYQPNKYVDVYLNDLTPFEWIKVFSFFKLTITHFFHGTMLSLVNGIPVIPVEGISSFSAINKTKIKDLMERLKISDWRFEYDHRSFSLFKRALHKYKICTDKKLWNEVCSKVDEFLKKDYEQIIKQKVEESRNSYISFRDALINIIEAKEKNNG